MFVMSLQMRRDIGNGYYQVAAIRTILVEEAFGDFNEKTFEDIRNFEEVWDWIENVLVEKQEGGVALVTLNRPKALNALCYDLFKDLHVALQDLD